MKKRKKGIPREDPAQPELEIQSLLTKIDFSPENVVSAAAENPILFVQAIQFRLSCLQKYNVAKMNWERTRADAELRLRQNARESGEKITEKNIEALLLQDEDVIASRIEFARADEMDEYSKLVVEAFRMRRDCLKIVGEMTRDELSLQKAIEIDSEKLAAVRQKLRERFPGGED